MRLVAARRLGRTQLQLHLLPLSLVLLLTATSAVDGVPLRIANDGVDSVVLAPIGRETIIIDTASNFHGERARWVRRERERGEERRFAGAASSARKTQRAVCARPPPPLRRPGHQQLDLGRACVSWSARPVDGCRTRKRNRCLEGWIGSAGRPAFLKAHQLRRFRQKTNAAAVVTCAPGPIRHSGRRRPTRTSNRERERVSGLVSELCTSGMGDEKAPHTQQQLDLD